MSLLGLVLLLSIPLVAFFIHGIGYRLGLWVSVSGQKSSLLSIAIATLINFNSFIVNESQLSLSSILYFIFLSPLVGHLYFQAFCLSETARRIRILVSIRKREFSFKDLAYDPTDMVEVRMERLKQLNQVRFDGNYFYPRWTILTFVALFFRFYERFLFHKRQTA